MHAHGVHVHVHAGGLTCHQVHEEAGDQHELDHRQMSKRDAEHRLPASEDPRGTHDAQELDESQETDCSGKAEQRTISSDIEQAKAQRKVKGQH